MTQEKIQETRIFKLIEADVDRVWRAMTQDAELACWLGQSASLTPAKDGELKVTSRIPHVGGTHRVRAIEPGRWLAFDWMIAGEPTAVSWRLEDVAGLTRVVVHHGAPSLRLLAEVWIYALDMLKTYIERGRADCMLPERIEPLRIDGAVEIDRAAADVFRALTTVEGVRRWNPFAGEDVRVEAQPGGRYSFGWKSESAGTDGPGEIVAYDDGRKLTYTWHGAQKTLVSWEVEPLADAPGPRSRLRLVHSGFVDDPDLVWEYRLGWANFLYLIKYSLEQPRPVAELQGWA